MARQLGWLERVMVITTVAVALTACIADDVAKGIAPASCGLTQSLADGIGDGATFRYWGDGAHGDDGGARVVVVQRFGAGGGWLANFGVPLTDGAVPRMALPLPDGGCPPIDHATYFPADGGPGLSLRGRVIFTDGGSAPGQTLAFSITDVHLLDSDAGVGELHFAGTVY